jgi:3-hydroxy-9,10-secoandrosta-1,3,5(10)-triene-9,17-dione monooxygenase reductase component
MGGEWGDATEQRAFRDVLGGYATGVALVTSTADDGRPLGVAVNSFTSVSLDPPLVSFCAAVTSVTWPTIRARGNFAVSILAEGHEKLSRLFATPGADRFADGAAFTRAPSGIPVLCDALGALDCTIETIVDAGDHELVLGRVHAMSPPREGRPLLFYRGGYARLEQP